MTKVALMLRCSLFVVLLIIYSREVSQSRESGGLIFRSWCARSTMRLEFNVGLVLLVVFYFFLELDAGPPPTGHHVLLAQMASLAEWDVRVVVVAELFRISFRVIQGIEESLLRLLELLDQYVPRL